MFLNLSQDPNYTTPKTTTKTVSTGKFNDQNVKLFYFTLKQLSKGFGFAIIIFGLLDCSDCYMNPKATGGPCTRGKKYPGYCMNKTGTSFCWSTSGSSKQCKAKGAGNNDLRTKENCFMK